MELEKALSTDDICSIINVCSGAGVSEFSLGDLKISFKDKKKTVEPHIMPSAFQSQESNPKEITQVEEDLDPKFNVDRERDLKAIEAQNALLEDPFLAEQMELAGDRMEEFMDELEKVRPNE